MAADRIASFNYKAIVLVCILVALYAYFGTPTPPATETLTLVSKYASLGKKIYYGAGYLGILLISSLSMVVLALTKSRAALIAFIILILAHCFDLTYNAITNGQFSVSDYIFLSKEIDNTFLALDEYKFIIIKSIIQVMALILVVLALRRFIRLKTRFGLHWLLLLAALSSVVYSLHASDGKRDNYVSPIRLPGIVVYSHLFPNESGLNIPYAPRVLDPFIVPEREPMASHILFVLDESVTAQYLSINGYPHETTPYLESIKDRFINLGAITSVANLSMTSNYILRNGVGLDQLPDHKSQTLPAPSLFNYAQRAGMHTALLDAQQQVTALQNYLSNYDLEHIDTYAYFPAKDKRYLNDFVAIDKIKEIQSANDSTFIMLVKYGAHFPYQDRYPADEAHFTPDLLTSNSGDDPYSHPDGRVMTANTYLNALRWNVDEFFAALLPELAMGTLIIYTSDHGQSILDEQVRANHGVTGIPPAAQVSVPLLLYPKTEFESLFPADFDSAESYSQFQVFPSLLKIMGYNDNIVKNYGLPFWEGVMEQKAFSGALFRESGLVSDVPAMGAKIALPDGAFAKELQN